MQPPNTLGCEYDAKVIGYPYQPGQKVCVRDSSFVLQSAVGFSKESKNCMDVDLSSVEKWNNGVLSKKGVVANIAASELNGSNIISRKCSTFNVGSASFHQQLWHYHADLQYYRWKHVNGELCMKVNTNKLTLASNCDSSVIGKQKFLHNDDLDEGSNLIDEESLDPIAWPIIDGRWNYYDHITIGENSSVTERNGNNVAVASCVGGPGRVEEPTDDQRWRQTPPHRS